MAIFPVVERELRVAARRKGTHWVRFSAAAGATVILAIIWLASDASGGPGEAGRTLFDVISGTALALCAVAGVFLTADCLSAEKREGTLGLLFLTDLSSWDIVLGKLAATSAVAIYALLALIPMLGLPLLMGGVTLAEFGRMILVLLATLLMSLGTGMYVSAICRETRTAMVGSFGVMLLFTGVDWLLACGAHALKRVNWIEYVLLPNPTYAWGVAHDSFPIFRGAGSYGVSVALVATIGLAQLVVASARLRRGWQAEEGERTWASKCRPARSERDRARLSAHPYRWLLSRDRFPGWGLHLVLFLLLAAWGGLFVTAWCSRVEQTRVKSFLLAFLMAFGLHNLAKGLMAVQFTRRLSEDRRSGALELLLTTSLSPAEILDGHRRVFRRQFLWIGLALAGMNIGLTWLACVGRSPAMPDNVRTVYCLFFLGGVALLRVDAQALAWVGLWAALRGQRHHRAVLGTIGRVLVVPWFALGLFVLLMSVLQPLVSEVAIVFWWMMYMTLSALVAGVAMSRASRQLREHFRLLASGDWPPRVRLGPERAWRLRETRAVA